MNTAAYWSILATICAVRILPKWAVAIMWFVAVFMCVIAGRIAA
ncbi:MAG TPA: hypothetical protein VMT67_03020 [Terriglobales bacterium]|nr:hypothetical protein [Terriglobales bacterium]